jgi:Secretion system C-terminal sorting domain
MRTGKFIVTLLITLSAVVAGYSQSHDDGGFGGFGPADRPGDVSKSISIYPNPAVESLNIKFDAPCAKRVKLSLHSVIGNTLEVEIEAIDDHEVHIKVANLPSGYYLLSVKDPDTDFRSTYKFLKR